MRPRGKKTGGSRLLSEKISRGGTEEPRRDFVKLCGLAAKKDVSPLSHIKPVLV
ncbi:Uncharacterized protein dnm_056520 [Desulfonema magnum]|uniref:Uncharacterized protein n=1 Tax=Desulfonema magnum TaxID=45655 RepID=A0A975BQ22_9BACT|nr:Uncharacterized protein dnm_056520 [Desulfonema magnum]